MILLVNNVHEKNHRKSRQTKFWKRMHATSNLHLCYNFALVLHKNALIFSQSEARNSFMYIIIIETHNHIKENSQYQQIYLCTVKKKALNLNRAIFNWVSKVIQNCFGFALIPPVRIDLQNLHHFLNQSDAKLKPITPLVASIFCTLGSLVVFTLSSYWLLNIFSFFWLVIRITLVLALWHSIEKHSNQDTLSHFNVLPSRWVLHTAIIALIASCK